MQGNSKILSGKDLRAGLLQSSTILPNSSDIFRIKKDGISIISINGYIIEDDSIVLDHINLDLPLQFLNCTFRPKDSKFGHWNFQLTCNKILTFDNCKILGSIYFDNGKFQDVMLNYTEIKHVNFNRSAFKRITISDCNIDSLIFMEIKANILNIFGKGKIKMLNFFLKEDNVDNTLIQRQSFDNISLDGTNKGQEIRFEDVECDNISIQNFKNEGSLKFFGIKPKNVNNDKTNFSIFNSNLEKAEFYRTSFSKYKELIIIDSFITDTLFIGCEWRNNIRSSNPICEELESAPITTAWFICLQSWIPWWSKKDERKITPEEIIRIKEAYRQLKVSMAKISDKVQEHKFYAEELNFHNKSLSCKTHFWDKLILGASKYFSNYGQSFIKPLLSLLFGHLFFFIIAILCDGFTPLHLSNEPTFMGFEVAFEKFFIYINPLRKVETSFSGYLILLDLLMRIWSSYMIYNLIRASRRFIS